MTSGSDVRNTEVSTSAVANRFAGNRILSRFEWAAEKLGALVPIAPGKIVNDIGAGKLEMREPTFRTGAEWTGFELLPGSSDTLKWDVEEPAPEGTPRAGVVLLLEVLEHLGNPWMAMRNIADVILPGGFLILTTPNPRWSRSRLYSLAKGELVCFTQSDLDLNHHVWPVWPHILERLFEDVGLEILEWVTLDGWTRWPRRPYDLRYPVRCTFALLNMLLEWHDPTACGMTYGVIARRLR